MARQRDAITAGWSPGLRTGSQGVQRAGCCRLSRGRAVSWVALPAQRSIETCQVRSSSERGALSPESRGLGAPCDVLMRSGQSIDSRCEGKDRSDLRLIGTPLSELFERSILVSTWIGHPVVGHSLFRAFRC
jgi:hypothetical protein